MSSTNTQDIASRWLPAANMTPAMQHLTQAFEAPAGQNHTELDLCLSAQDGTQLWATVFEPRTPARAVALVAPATAVPRSYYRAFARWLSTRGYAVITLDYRGIGDSRLAVQPTRSISMRDWMQQDLQAALGAVQHRAQAGTVTPLATLWIGHSLGGHALAQCQGWSAWTPPLAWPHSCRSGACGPAGISAWARCFSSASGYPSACACWVACRAGPLVVAKTCPPPPRATGAAGA